MPGPCPSGFISELGTCVDINECEMYSNLCENGFCSNTEGSFKCVCPKGLTLDSTGRKCNGSYILDYNDKEYNSSNLQKNIQTYVEVCLSEITTRIKNNGQFLVNE